MLTFTLMVILTRSNQKGLMNKKQSMQKKLKKCQRIAKNVIEILAINCIKNNLLKFKIFRWNFFLYLTNSLKFSKYHKKGKKKAV